MEDLKKIREKITEIDNQMAQLFEARMRQVAKVAEYKRQNGLPIYDPKRENEVIAKGEARVADPELKSYYGQFLRDVMAVSRRYQARLLEGLRVAYCGTEGAFAHIAASRIFPMGQKIAYSGFPKAYEAVVQGACDCAVLPVENSFAGDVDQVNDLMFTGPLHINGMYDLAVTHDLLTVPGATMDDIKTVVSHPQALSQCANFIREHELEEVEYSNTALAAAYVREQNDKSIAAIGSAESAAGAGGRTAPTARAGGSAACSAGLEAPDQVGAPLGGADELVRPDDGHLTGNGRIHNKIKSCCNGKNAVAAAFLRSEKRKRGQNESDFAKRVHGDGDRPSKVTK